MVSRAWKAFVAGAYDDQMKVKIFRASSAGRLERKVNQFLESVSVRVIDVRLAGGFGEMSVLVRYEEQEAG